MAAYKTEIIFPDTGTKIDGEPTANIRDLFYIGKRLVRAARRHGYHVRYTVFDAITGEPLLKFYCRKAEPIRVGYVCRLTQFCFYGRNGGLTF